jgi:hypothetical protein
MPVWLLYGMLLVFALLALWLPFMLFLALFSGWWELSRVYPRQPPATGARRGAGSVLFGPLFRYRHVVAWADDGDVLHLGLPPIVGAFHPPMSIPWAAIEFDQGDRRVAGFIPVKVERRRLFLSKAMVSRELEIRRQLAAAEGADAHPADPNAGPNANPNARSTSGSPAYPAGSADRVGGPAPTLRPPTPLPRST